MVTVECNSDYIFSYRGMVEIDAPAHSAMTSPPLRPRGRRVHSMTTRSLISSSPLSSPRRLCWWAAWALAATTLVVQADIKATNFPLHRYIWLDAIIQAPGSVDLSNLTFSALTPDNNNNNIITINQNNSAVIEVAIFQSLSPCPTYWQGCDAWVQAGVGKSSAAQSNSHDGSSGQEEGNAQTGGDILWCCDQWAASRGLCTLNDTDQRGKLMIDWSIYQGYYQTITVTRDGPVAMQPAVWPVNVSGDYVVFFASCRANSFTPFIAGQAKFHSLYGYLPGEMYVYVALYAAMSAIYLAASVIYGRAMCRYRDSRVETEQWILFSLVLGFLNMMAMMVYLIDWNNQGTYNHMLVAIKSVLGVLKEGVLLGLVFLISLGRRLWCRVLTLGSLYIAASATAQSLITFYDANGQSMSLDRERTFVNTIMFLFILILAVGLVFICWTICAFRHTTRYLQDHHQGEKITRYIRLRNVFLVVVLVATAGAAALLFSTANDFGDIQRDHQMLVQAILYIDYMVLGLALAWLWRPSLDATEYSFILDHAASFADDDDEEDDHETGGDEDWVNDEDPKWGAKTRRQDQELELSATSPSHYSSAGPPRAATGNHRQQQPPLSRNGFDLRFSIDDAELRSA